MILSHGRGMTFGFGELPINRRSNGSKETKMKDALLKKYISFRHCDEGVTLVEYGIAIALAITLGTGALALLAGSIGTSMGAAGTLMPV